MFPAAVVIKIGAAGLLGWSVRAFAQRAKRRHLHLSAREERIARSDVGPFADDILGPLIGEDGVLQWPGDGDVPAPGLQEPTAAEVITSLHAHPIAEYNVSGRFVRYATKVLKAKLGYSVCVDTPPNRLVIARVFNQWAAEHGMRPTHIANFGPYVLEAMFIPTIHERRMAVIRASAARERALESVHRLGKPDWLTRLLIAILDMRITVGGGTIRGPPPGVA